MCVKYTRRPAPDAAWENVLFLTREVQALVSKCFNSMLI